MTRCPTCHDFRRVCDGADGSVPCPVCATATRADQIKMLAQATQRANDFCGLALAVVDRTKFDVEAATACLIEAMACVAAAFDDEIPHDMLRRVIERCGLSMALPGVPANDDQFVGGAA